MHKKLSIEMNSNNNFNNKYKKKFTYELPLIENFGKYTNYLHNLLK